MRKYEAILIFDPNLNETQVREEAKKFEKFIEQNSGTDVKLDLWGKKEIAYKVGKHKFGTFACLNFDLANHEQLSGLTNLLSLTDSVIKFQAHRLSDRVRKFKGNPKRQRSGGSDDDFGLAQDIDY